MTHITGQIGLSGNEKLPGSGIVDLGRRIDVAAVKVRGDRITRPRNATKSIAWKREQLRFGKRASAWLTFIVDKPNEECRVSINRHYRRGTG